MQKLPLWQLVKIKTWKLDANAKVDWWQYPFFTCSKDVSRIDKYTYDCECVLVAWNWDLNVKYYNWKFDAYQRTYIIEDNKTQELDIKYLYYFMQSYIETLRSQTIWWVIQYIKLNNLTDIDFPLQPLSTQKQIIEKLDTLKNLINLRKLSIEKTEKLTKSIFIEMFWDPMINEKGWEVKELSNLKTEFRYWTSEKSTWKWLPVLRIPNIVSWINLDDLKYCELNSSELEKCLLKHWDVLFVRTNWNPDFVWRSAVFNLDWDYIYASYLIRTRLKLNLINPIYLLEFLRTEHWKKLIKKVIKTSAGQYNINTEGLWWLEIPVPPISLQNKFASIVEKNEENIKKQKESLKKLEELYSGIMQESFRI